MFTDKPYWQVLFELYEKNISKNINPNFEFEFEYDFLKQKIDYYENNNYICLYGSDNVFTLYALINYKELQKHIFKNANQFKFLFDKFYSSLYKGLDIDREGWYLCLFAKFDKFIYHCTPFGVMINGIETNFDPINATYIDHCIINNKHIYYRVDVSSFTENLRKKLLRQLHEINAIKYKGVSIFAHNDVYRKYDRYLYFLQADIIFFASIRINL